LNVFGSFDEFKGLKIKQINELCRKEIMNNFYFSKLATLPQHQGMKIAFIAMIVGL
jgi:hypothetical protein